MVRRDQLSDLAAFAGTLLHELAHARSGEPDGTLELDDALSATRGRVPAARAHG